MKIASDMRRLGTVGAAAATLVFAGRLSAQLASETQTASTQDSPKFSQKVQPKESDNPQRQGFNVVLLLGDMQAGDGPDTVPPAARRALVDMKDFLPYKSYRLLDTQWTLCCSTTSSAITRLRGLENQEYELELRSNYEGVDRLSVRFVLRDVNDAASKSGTKSDGSKDGDASERLIAEINREIFNLERERVDLNAQVTRLRKQVDVVGADPEVRRVLAQLQTVTSRINVLKTQLASVTSSSTKFASRPVIDTSFRLDIGETVVVGTSGLKGGNRALIALLTAVPAKAKGR